jgi:hypothetical protein
MTRERARAYARVMKTLRDIGAATVHPSEQAIMRHAADTLLFCADIVHDRSARAAYAAFGAVEDRLVDSGRWTQARADAFADDIWGCGPGLPVPLQRAA